VTSSIKYSDTWPFTTPRAIEIFARKKREGRRDGYAEAILILLRARNLNVNDAERACIVSCTNVKQFKKWVRRAVTVEKTSDLFD
jgi:hypothetical protein